jgi:hypothetical protein
VSDFVTTGSLPASPPHCVLATNATVAQTLTSPAFGVEGLVLQHLVFQIRRSSTFRAPVSVEASADGGLSWPFRIGDTLRADGSPGVYRVYRCAVPPLEAESLRVRWRVIPEASGSTGTLRIDDIRVEAQAFRDLALCAFQFVPSRAGEPLEARLQIANAGLLPVGLCAVAVWVDSGSLPAEPVTRTVMAPAPGESLWVALAVGRTPERPARAAAEVSVEADRRAENNRLEILLEPGAPEGSVVFNEIMFAPRAGEPEYVELALRASEPSSMKNWMLEWGPAGSPPTGRLLFPDSAWGGYRVVASDTPHVPAHAGGGGLVLCPELVLRNDGSVLVLRDPAGIVADSLQYAPAWHTPSVVDTRGRSLEKILAELPSADGRNWATSTELSGGTPGRLNSVALSAGRTRETIACSPNPFSPDGDGHDDWTVVRYAFAHAVHTVDLTVHDGRGRMVRHLATHELGGRTGTVVWDGRNDERETVRMGIYVVAVQAVDATTQAVTGARTVVVVARPLR